MNSNSAPMLGNNRDLDRHGYYCKCQYCGDNRWIKNKLLRTRSKRAWKRDQDV